ncbi:hypothetical protein [Nonomuraea cypriaca]|nr:hypothetical protein [Nonomuraea cypriaca]
MEELTKAVSPHYDIDPDGIRRTPQGNIRGMVRLPTTVSPA